jgi:hypothetical protein
MNTLLRLAAIVLLIGMSGCEDVAYVERVVIMNPTPYDLEVEVKGTGDRRPLSLGITPHNAETVKEQVIDMGDTWIFLFSYLEEEEVGEESVKRDDLVRNRWRFVIPEEIGERLEERGVRPSYLSDVQLSDIPRRPKS